MSNLPVEVGVYRRVLADNCASRCYKKIYARNVTNHQIGPVVVGDINSDSFV